MYKQNLILPNDKTVAIRVNPKCGKSTVASIVCYPHRGKHKPIINPARELERYGRVELTEEHEPDYRIAVVRDPVRRLCSAYLDRIVTKNRENLQKKIRSWSQFLAKLERLQNTSRDIAIHTTPQVRRLGTDASVYDRVFTTQQLSNEFLEYLEQIGGFAIPPIKFNTTEHTLARYTPVTARDREYIRELYDMDYRYWGSYFDGPVKK